MDYDYIVNHAKENVWCSPRQDMQVIIEPAKITGSIGSLKSTRLMWQDISLPDQTNRWHVYQIGGTHPTAFNLFERHYQWVRISDACNEKNMIADVYTTKGYHYPLFDAYYAYTFDHNLVLALKVNTKLPINLNNEKIYIRLYSNAYFNSNRSSHIQKKIDISGKIIESNTDLSSLKSKFDSYSSKPGKAVQHVDGVRYRNWFDAPIGSCVEVIYDSSIKAVVEIPLKEADTFSSELDAKLKYILHYAGSNSGTIDYQDDIDYYLYNKDLKKELYYNKNNVDAVRNLTHKDYSIVATYVARYANTFQAMPQAPAVVDGKDLVCVLYIRHSGWQRPLVYENSRIHELYKLNDLDLKRAMSGIDSTVEVWQAAKLESSGYTEVMRSRCCDITNEMVQRAYGYNAISKVLADTPQKPKLKGTTKVIEVPYKLRYGAGAYEYDDTGLLLGVYTHWAGPQYVCHNANCDLVEMIAGYPATSAQEYHGATQLDLSDLYSYRVYACTRVSGVPDNKWQDVTDTDKVQLTETSYKWLDTSQTLYPMVRSDKLFISRDIELDVADGQMQFTLQAMTHVNGNIADSAMQIPMGQLDIFLNGRSLIKDLDYFVNFPQVMIVNKKYLKRPIASNKQKVHIRFTGLCDKDMQITSDGNVGYIEHGYLSNNNKFDLRDDKVLRIVVDGCLYAKDELEYSEEHSGVQVNHRLNGLPYMVKDILVPVASHTLTDTYELRRRSMAIDKAVSEYMTLKLPQPDRNAPSAIAQKYQLYSPFFNRIVMDLYMQRLHLPQQPDGYTRQQVIDICHRYEYLLQYDPTQVLRRQDYRYVVVHPHGLDGVLDLKKHQYQFVTQAVGLYANGLIDLSQTLRMVD